MRLASLSGLVVFALIFEADRRRLRGFERRYFFMLAGVPPLTLAELRGLA